MIFDNFFKRRINSNLTKINEEKLYRKYGNCESLHKSIKLLTISDTHEHLSYNLEWQEKLVSSNDYDLCCILGDISHKDIEFVLQHVPKDKIVGVLGNHDNFTFLKEHNIQDINGKTIDINGIKIGGIQGAIRCYGEFDYPCFSHSDSIKFMNEMPEVDILLSHSGPFYDYNDDPFHNGLKGITNYLYKNKTPINIHGHLHKNKLKVLKNGTKVQCIYGVELIEINDGEIKVMS